jgi:hypothetical protein
VDAKLNPSAPKQHAPGLLPRRSTFEKLILQIEKAFTAEVPLV